jgi:hypothetical protein
MKHIPTFESFLFESKSQDIENYSIEVIKELKNLGKKEGRPFKDNYLDEFSKTEDFKNMIQVELMNRKTVKQAAKSIFSIWR